MNRKAFPDFMPCRYKTYKDLYDRLSGTVCRYDGRPVYVNVQHEVVIEQDVPVHKPIVTLYEWPNTDRQIKRIEPDDPKFDISLIEVGYFNHNVQGKNRVVYASRSTRKQWKQGMTPQGCKLHTIDGQPGQFGNTQTPLFVDSIQGKFPTIDVLDRGETEVALSQELAVRTDELGIREYFWRTKKIAVKVPGAPLHRLETEFSWLIDKVLGGLV